MLLEARNLFHNPHSRVSEFPSAGLPDARSAEETRPAGPTRRLEGRIEEQNLCTYELCESIDEKAVVIQQGRAYSLNRSQHGILLLMGYAPRVQQLIELHIPESRWLRSLSLYEVQWVTPARAHSHGNFFLVGCRLTFGPSRYWAF